MSVLSALHTGGRGLGAASKGIEVTSQNVTNVNTPGYARRSVEQSTMDPIDRRGMSLGQGVSVTGVHRASDRFLGAQFIRATGDNAYAGSLEQSMRITETYFNETNTTGVVEAFDAFFDAADALAADPTDDALRQGLIVAGNTFANVTSRTATGLQSTIDGFNESVETGLGDINGQLAQIARLNEGISMRGGNAPDLMDQRAQLVESVGESIGAIAEFGANGDVSLYVGGHAVVSGSASRTLSVADDASGTPQLYVSADSGQIRVTDDIGGKLGGTIEARQKTQDYLDKLDAVALTFATAFNAQHAAGVDQSGAPGGDFFTVSAVNPAATLTVDASLQDDPSLLAIAGASSVLAGDQDNLTALRAIEDDNTLFAGGTGHATLSALVSEVGNDTAAASINVEATGAALEDVVALHDAVTAVDSDEEAIHLLEYQSAYRAAAKVISAADEMMQDLIGMVR